ncbi:hypothetical protein [Mongoliitalea daihaiensis]|uniref:hypothetical protein n=1 Tax=Mongoliitalea daihaiensis TaxID=2782006 RepID=UPI001F397B16|nr:hypothetical protein [Mongoliitalea daihaiensis]UJP64364.1 hypothetical protein IPZ59_16355 [Mongoliitalea daihaiensis]
MKNYINSLPALAIAAIVSFSSCNSEDDIPAIGQGEGRIGIALVLKNNSTTSNSARMENSNLSIENGFIQIKEIELELDGRNEQGSFEKEIEFEFNEIKKVTFNEFDKSVDFFINIPEGEYKEIELELDLIDYKNEPSIYFEGTFTTNDGASIPFQFEFFGDEIDFEVEIEAEDDRYFRIDRINNPLALFELNALNWLRNVSSIEMTNAEQTNGVILINRDNNSSIYSKIKSNIKASSEIEVEIN